MKILFVQKEGGIFGAENYQLKVIPGLLAKGVNVEFLRLYTNYQGGIDGDFIKLLAEMGVKTYQINIGKYPSFKVLRSIHRIAFQVNYDLIHTHLIHADFHLGLSKLLFRGKYKIVSTKHGYDNNFTTQFGFDASKQTKTPYFLISRWAEKRMIASFTISNGLKDFFISTGITTASKMSLIHYGFDMPDYYLSKGNKNLRFAPKQILIAGRLVGFKGHAYLIEAMTTIIENDPDVKLIIVGSGHLEEELKSLVKRLALSENVLFLGYRKDVGELMANSDLVAIPSVSEGFGVVFLEAFSAKAPVVAWDVPAGNELLTHEETGFLVEPYNVKKLADQVIKILEADNFQLCKDAYDRLTSYYNLNRMVDQTIDFYKKAIS